MAGSEQALTGPDFSEGFDQADLQEGEPILGHKNGEAVLLALLDGRIHAVGASCTHYGGPLGDGLVVDGTVRCPWHHACFSLRTGEALAAPALNPLPTWNVEVRDGRVFLGSKHEEAPLSPLGRQADGPERVVIVGAGAAGSAAAEALRREGHVGSVTLVDPDPDAPYDRPNLSKDYLAGDAPEEWIPLRPPDFYGENGIERVMDRAVGLDRERGVVELPSGGSLPYDALLLATGAEVRTLDVPGVDAPHVHTLRSLADCRGIIEDAEAGSRAVVVGASFIGMETAASLRARELEVTVVAPEQVPFERALGFELGALLRETHEENGVAFRLGRTLDRIEEGRVILDDGSEVDADLVVVGVGVRPETGLAEAAGLSADDGILVDSRLRTADPRIWVAGDAARFPDARSGKLIRIEHWVVAQRQGQTAARNILGHDEPFDDVPFFWTMQFGVGVSYVGHAEEWDRVSQEGDEEEGRAFRYYEGDQLLALATLGRDRLSLETEVELEAGEGSSSGRTSR